MKELFFAIFLLAFSNSSISQSLTTEQQMNDFLSLKEGLNNVHPTLLRFCSKEKLDSVFKSVENNITKERSVEEFGQVIFPIFLSIKDAHTYFILPKSKTAITKFIPIDVKIISGRLYLFRSFDTKQPIKPGTEILEINNMPVNEIIDKMKLGILSDGYIATTKDRAVEEWFKYLYANNYGKSDEFILRLNNQSKRITVKAVSMEEVKSIKNTNPEKYPKEKLAPPYYSFTINSKKNAAIIKIEWFEKIPFIQYQLFLDSCFLQLEEKKISDLIIDLRWNIGGPREYPVYLYSKIANKPFSYCKELITTSQTVNSKIPFDSLKKFERIDDKFYSVKSEGRGLGIQQPTTKPYLGKVYLLIDGQSNSSSAQFAAIFHENSRGKIVGEEPGGLFEGGTGEHHYYLKLPNSKIVVQIPRYRIVLAVDENKFEGHGVKPHYELKEDLKSVIKGRDCILEFTLGLIK